MHVVDEEHVVHIAANAVRHRGTAPAPAAVRRVEHAGQPSPFIVLRLGAGEPPDVSIEELQGVGSGDVHHLLLPIGSAIRGERESRPAL